jgi:hypothetical protein
MFVAYGASTLALAWALRPRATRWRGTIGLSLLVAAGVGQASAAVLDINQQGLHELAGVIGVLGLPVGALLVSPEIATAGFTLQLRFTAHLTWVSLVLLAASFAVMIATFMHALGSLPDAPPPELPSGVIALVGWTDRLVLLSAWAWVCTAALAVLRSEAELRVAQSARATPSPRGSVAAT